MNRLSFQWRKWPFSAYLAFVSVVIHHVSIDFSHEVKGKFGRGTTQPDPERGLPTDHRNWVKTWPWLNDWFSDLGGSSWLRMELRTWIFLTPKILENRQRCFLETSRWWRLKHYIIICIYIHRFSPWNSGTSHDEFVLLNRGGVETTRNTFDGRNPAPLCAVFLGFLPCS